MFYQIEVRNNITVFKPALHIKWIPGFLPLLTLMATDKEPNCSAVIRLSINLPFSCPSSNFLLFMSNSEDQDTPYDNEQERDSSKATFPRKRNRMDLQTREVMVHTQRDLELSLKRRSISGAFRKI